MTILDHDTSSGISWFYDFYVNFSRTFPLPPPLPFPSRGGGTPPGTAAGAASAKPPPPPLFSTTLGVFQSHAGIVLKWLHESRCFCIQFPLDLVMCFMGCLLYTSDAADE